MRPDSFFFIRRASFFFGAPAATNTACIVNSARLNGRAALPGSQMGAPGIEVNKRKMVERRGAATERAGS